MFDIEEYINALPWSKDVTELEKALVAGNLRKLYGELKSLKRIMCAYCGHLEEAANEEDARERMGDHTLTCSRHPFNLLVSQRHLLLGAISKLPICDCHDGIYPLPKGFHNDDCLGEARDLLEEALEIYKGW